MIGLYVVVSSYIFNTQFEHLKRRRHVLPALRNSLRPVANSNKARKAVCVRAVTSCYWGQKCALCQ
jgi:hypothetical protein